MKKILSLAMSLAMIFSLAACSPAENSSSTPSSFESSQSSAPAEKIQISVAALKGPTAIGMVEMMHNAQEGTTANDYQFTLAGAPEELVGKIVQGEFDIAAVPTNLASTLYNKTEGEVQLAALNTLGVLYIVENGDTIHSMADLAGKTIYATGAGSTPEFALNYLLEQNGLQVGTDVQVEYKTEHSELATLLASGQADIALLPQPFVTSVLNQNEQVRVALDLTEEWEKATQGASVLTMGCVVVQKSFAEEHPEALAQFMAEYEASVNFVNDPANLETAAQYTEDFDIIAAAVAQKAIPQCNIVFMTGEEMQQATQGFLEVLFEADPASVGGKLPDEGFYYQAQA